MSAQYGRWNFDGSVVGDIEQARALLSSYGPDGEEIYSSKGISILLRAFSTTEELVSKRQSLIAASGAVITWDGRLDNREELLSGLDGKVTITDGDVAIVRTAYERWQAGCFKKFSGDWAISIWNTREKTLLLARDVAGVRHLYYSMEGNSVTWSTILAPLVYGRRLTLDEAYIAGWLTSFPAAHLTPYVEVQSVPPGCFLEITSSRCLARRYWEFDGGQRITYRSDTDYEEHFRALFEQSIRRRLRANAPVLAELSGGMDSNAVVAMADLVTDKDSGKARVDTVSYYNDGEPNWDERPWFSGVEKRRGKTGLHIDSGSLSFEHTSSGEIALWPGAKNGASPLVDWMRLHGHRVVLSGIGGDEFLGGVPTPLPELEDLLARCRIRELARRLKAWTLVQRRPWIHLLRDAIAGFLPLALRPSDPRRQPTWLHPDFLKRNQPSLRIDQARLTIFSAMPSLQENLGALDRIARQLAATEICSVYPYEKRYPYLDRDLLEFLFSIPREQLVRPGERRSLMRRSLRGIVPDEILNRKRKAYVIKSPLAAIAREHKRLTQSNNELVTGALRIVATDSFMKVLEEAGQGKEIPVVPLLRALALERWLQSLRASGFLNGRSVQISLPEEVVTRLRSASSTKPSSLISTGV
ncbi:asparagine synthetase B [Edaphobacter acidisoli]|uniref:asparagine synthase (glutamine-hydrolyzing) n=1 Tax=Edaphobacter acidisoli TaxID=2040573 RepID=A0A916S4I6_9BACT|nr:asparagine synthase-related protein [Edaphobacter acidisoli]GGA80351.1 asparagine synthetase B [Edaphobacter acidisoli]